MILKEQFVEEIYLKVRMASYNAMLKNLEKPAGRSPQPKLKKMSEWYNSLDVADQDQLKCVMKDAIDEAVFSFLCVLDEVRKVEHIEWDFTLKPTSDNETTEETDNFLHDIYNFKIQNE